ncbi:MAG: cytochrome c [Rhodobacteraceae bacterium]|nr:cytochrome c [Paracoccaceae bacterium]
MKFSHSTIAAFISVSIAASAFAASHSPVSQRQAAMKSVGEQMRTLGGMAQGKVEYDDFAAFSALEIMRDAALVSRPLFAESTDTGEETRAKAAIWAEGSDFDTEMEAFIATLDVAIAADPADLDNFKPLFARIASSCKSCHEDYRAPKD